MKHAGRGASLVAMIAVAASMFAASIGSRANQDDAPRPARVGEKAPGFSLRDSGGTRRELADYEGRIVVLEWANRRCPVYTRVYESGVMQRAIEQAKRIDEQVVWLAINSTHDANATENREWVRKHALAHPFLLDDRGEVGRQYQARTTPHMFVIDATGTLVYSGALDDDPNGKKAPAEVTNYVVEAIRQLKAGEKVEPAETRPYGCAVKYAE